MNYYQILSTRKVPQKFLTFSHEDILPKGQLVDVNIRGTALKGIVMSKIENDNVFDIDKIKPISKIPPFIFNSFQINFLLSFTQNTFNQINTVFSGFLKPFSILTQKQWQSLLASNLNTNLEFESENKLNLEVNFILDMYITLRIIYIIRTIINNKHKSTTIIIFPEKKYLEKTMLELESSTEFKELAKDIEIYTYSGDANKKSKLTVWNLISPENINPKIIFSTRAGLFLPFQKLNEIILIDESNSMYIQDQNSLYFDTRDAVFLMSKSYGANLTFLSTLPSVRLFNFYNKEVVEQIGGGIKNEID